MPAKTLHFKVGNGDMTLMETASGRKILVDINICAADEPTVSGTIVCLFDASARRK